MNQTKLLMQLIENNANLRQTNNVTNTGAITVNRNTSNLKRGDYSLISSPVASQNLQAYSPATLSNRFYNYDTTTNFYSAVVDPSSTTFGTGEGYLIRMPNDASTTATAYSGVYTGVPNNGDIPVALAGTEAGKYYNLVGNPYPSPISAATLIANNVPAGINDSTGTLYFWRRTNNEAGTYGNSAYCTISAAGSFASDSAAQVVDPNGIIQTGQGFFVEAT